MQEKQSLALDIRFQIKDIWRYNVAIAYKTPLSRLVVLAGILLFAWIIYGAVTSPYTIDVYLSRNIFSIVIAVMLIIPKIWRIWTITAMQLQSPIFSGTTHYVFSKEDIYMKVADLEDTVAWTTYAHIVETKHDFRMFVDSVQAQILPKHNMTPEQIVAFKEIVKQAKSEDAYKFK